MSVRAKVEHTFYRINRKFACGKVRCRGLEKNGSRLYLVVCFASFLRAGMEQSFNIIDFFRVALMGWNRCQEKVCMSMSTQYIKSIDGLRAVAVMLVVFFHSGFNQFLGGFVGVDVFYVISGFLITKIIIDQRESGAFRFGEFYQRRIARLFPALLTVVFVTLAASYFILAPEDLKRLGQAATYSTLSVSNIFFWLESGYFDRSSELKPLLHTWSLSVEEQFYLLWPALIGVLFFIGKRSAVIVGMFAFSIVSLLISIYFYESKASAVFFLTPFRVYQFGIGALIALIGLHDYKPHKRYLAIASVIGLIVLAANIDGQTHVLLSAVLPAFLAGLFIYGSQANMANQVFGNSLMVWIGQRSYSIYLVHWPLMVLWKTNTDYEFTVFESLLAVVLSIFLGYLLHLLVEKRFRLTANMSLVIRHRIATASIVMLVANITIASHLWGNDGFPNRVPDDLKKYASNLMPEWNARKSLLRDGVCNLSSGNKYKDFDVDRCLSINENKKNWLIFGDSYASGAYAIFNRAYPDVNFLQLTLPGCHLRPPKRITGEKMCDELQKMMYQFIEKEVQLDGVIIASNWRNGHIYVVEDIVRLLEGFNKEVIVINQRIRFKDRVPAIAASAMSHEEATVKANYLIKKESFSVRDSIRDRLENSVSIVDIMGLQCAEVCDIFGKNGKLLYLDDSHFSKEGLYLISDRMLEKYGETLNEIFARSPKSLAEGVG